MNNIHWGRISVINLNECIQPRRMDNINMNQYHDWTWGNDKTEEEINEKIK